MTPELERKLKAASPTGEIHELAEEALMSTEHNDRLIRAIQFIAAQLI